MRRSSEDPGCAHELTFSCYRRLPLLSTDRTRRWLLDGIEAARRKLHFELWAYVIMPDHVHLLVCPLEQEYRIRSILQAVKQPVMRRAITHLRRHSPGWLVNLTNARTGDVHFWQPGGGYDRNIVSAQAAWSAVEYIHQNPVRTGLVDEPRAWAWSSARWYAGCGEVHLSMDGTPPAIPQA